MAHTPGEWIDEDEDGVITVRTGGCVDEEIGICMVLAGPDAADNAALIKAAPKLLAALEESAIAFCDATCPAVWKTDEGRPHGPLCKANYAAIAAARGEA